MFSRSSTPPEIGQGECWESGGTRMSNDEDARRTTDGTAWISMPSSRHRAVIMVFCVVRSTASWPLRSQTCACETFRRSRSKPYGSMFIWVEPGPPRQSTISTSMRLLYPGRRSAHEKRVRTPRFARGTAPLRGHTMIFSPPPLLEGKEGSAALSPTMRFSRTGRFDKKGNSYSVKLFFRALRSRANPPAL